MREVVITGLGLVTPAGLDVASTWERVVAGKAAAAPDEVLSEAGLPVTLSCRVPRFDPDEELGRGTSRRLDPFTWLALLAAREAIGHAGLAAGTDDATHAGDADGLSLDVGVVDRDRVGVLVGSGIGGADTWSSEFPNFLERGPDKVSPMFVPRMLSNTAAGSIAIRSGARGPNLTVNTACAAGASAIHVARDLIRAGAADVVIAGGAEAGIMPLSVAAFARMGALSTNPDAMTASRPFDVDRDGFVMGEGAGMMVLESAEHAAARGAAVLGRVAGAGASADAHHVTAPPEDGAGAVMAIRRALEEAGVDASDLTHVNTHGTSTPLNDAAEARALRTVLGDGLDEVPLTSTKGVLGHLLGATGAVEAILALLALREGVIPPTAGTTTVDPSCDVDVVTGTARPLPDRPAALSNSFGFGGQNATLVLTR